MMMLSENKEIIYKSLIIIGGISLSIGLGNHLYNYYKILKKNQEDYKKKLLECQKDFAKNNEINEINENNEINKNN
jgi:hypothetical protein